MERCRRVSGSGDAIRREIGNARLLVVLARLEPQKGHSVLLQALPSVIAAHTDVRVAFLGDGALRSELQSMAIAAGIDSHVLFAGYQGNIDDWLDASEFSILPSFYEGLPLAAIESLSAARTVVATSVDGTTEVVIDGVTGLTVPPGDPKRLAAAIFRLLQDREWARSLGADGQRFVNSHFSLERQVRETEDLYLGLMSQKTANLPAQANWSTHHGRA
jgi:glycosyltransferase involved in cell wall biosynthesis